MRDLAMCQDILCPARHLCQRHPASGTRPDAHWQTYADFQRPADLTRCYAFVPTAEAAELDELRDGPSYG